MILLTSIIRFVCQCLKMKISWRYNFLGYVWYMCLKIENCYLKIFVKIRVDEKVYKNT